MISAGGDESIVTTSIAGTPLTCSPERFLILAVENKRFHNRGPDIANVFGTYYIMCRYMGILGWVGADVGAVVQLGSTGTSGSCGAGCEEAVVVGFANGFAVPT